MAPLTRGKKCGALCCTYPGAGGCLSQIYIGCTAIVHARWRAGTSKTHTPKYLCPPFLKTINMTMCEATATKLSAKRGARRLGCSVEQPLGRPRPTFGRLHRVLPIFPRRGTRVRHRRSRNLRPNFGAACCDPMRKNLYKKKTSLPLRALLLVQLLQDWFPLSFLHKLAKLQGDQEILCCEPTHLLCVKIHKKQKPF